MEIKLTFLFSCVFKYQLLTSEAVSFLMLSVF